MCDSASYWQKMFDNKDSLSNSKFKKLLIHIKALLSLAYDNPEWEHGFSVKKIFITKKKAFLLKT